MLPLFGSVSMSKGRIMDGLFNGTVAGSLCKSVVYMHLNKKIFTNGDVMRSGFLCFSRTCFPKAIWVLRITTTTFCYLPLVSLT